MKNAATVRRVGFLLACLGVLCPVGLMYQLKLFVVDHWSSGVCYDLNVAAMFIVQLCAACFFRFANKLDKSQSNLS